MKTGIDLYFKKISSPFLWPPSELRKPHKVYITVYITIKEEKKVTRVQVHITRNFLCQLKNLSSIKLRLYKQNIKNGKFITVIFKQVINKKWKNTLQYTKTSQGKQRTNLYHYPPPRAPPPCCPSQRYQIFEERGCSTDLHKHINVFFGLIMIRWLKD